MGRNAEHPLLQMGNGIQISVHSALLHYKWNRDTTFVAIVTEVRSGMNSLRWRDIVILLRKKV